MSDSSAIRKGEENLVRLVEAFEAEVRAGHVPSVEDWAQRHPAHADDIRSLFPSLLLIENSASGMQGETNAPATPDSIGPYPILRELGRGGMGVVYLAEDRKLARRVALKAFHNKSRRDDRFMERFLREARAAGQLNHPHIVSIIESGTDGEIPYYTMQYIEGFPLDEFIFELQRSASSTRNPRSTHSTIHDLFDRMGERLEQRVAPESESNAGPAAFELDWREATRICREVGQALAYAHGQGILHRDIKPANILLDRQGHAWVTDFGLCHWEGESSMTEEGEVVGTLRYMAPEQLEGEPDERSDVYCLGLVLYELVTRKEAFPEVRKGKLIKSILSADPIRPRKLVRGIPKDLETIICKATAKLPQERYASASTFARDLLAFEDGKPIQARPLGAWYLTSLLIRRNRVASLVLAIALIGIAALTVWYTQNLRAEQEQTARGEYNARLTAAESALNSGSVDRGIQQLQLAPERFRGWEWYHLRARIDQSLVSLRVADYYSRDLVYSSDGELLASASRNGIHLLKPSDNALFIIRYVSGNANNVVWWPDNRGCIAFFANGKVLDIPLDPELPTEDLGTGPTEQVFADWTPNGTILVAFDSGLVQEFNPGTQTWGPVADQGTKVVGMHVDQDFRVWLAAATGKSMRNKGLGQWDLLPQIGQNNVLRAALDPGRDVVHYIEADGSLRWMRTDAPAEKGAYLQSSHGLHTLALDPSGERIASGGKSRVLHQWDVDSRKHLLALVGPPGRIDTIQWRPDGKRIVTGDDRGFVHLWHPLYQGGKMQLGHQFHDVSNVEFNAAGDHALTSGRDGSVALWDLTRAAHVRNYWGIPGAVWESKFACDESVVVAVSQLGRAMAWDRTSSKEVWRSLRSDRPTAHTIDISVRPSTNELLLASSKGGKQKATWIEFWDTDSWTRKDTWELTGVQLYDLAYEPNRDEMVGVDSAGQVIRLDLTGRNVARRIQVQPDRKRLQGINLSPDGSRAVAVDWTELAYVVSLVGDANIRTFNNGGNIIHDASFLPGQNRLLGGTRSGQISIWDLDSGIHLTDIDSLEHWAVTVGGDPTGARIVAGGSHGAVMMYDTSTTSKRWSMIKDLGPGGPEPKSRAQFGRETVWTGLGQARRRDPWAFRITTHLASIFSFKNTDIYEAKLLQGARKLIEGDDASAIDAIELVLRSDRLDPDLKREAYAILAVASLRARNGKHSALALQPALWPSMLSWSRALRYQQQLSR